MGFYPYESEEFGIKLYSKDSKIYEFREYDENPGAFNSGPLPRALNPGALNYENQEETPKELQPWELKLNEFLEEHYDEEFVVLAYLLNVCCALVHPPTLNKIWWDIGSSLHYYKGEPVDKKVKLIVIKNNLYERRLLRWPETEQWFKFA